MKKVSGMPPGTSLSILSSTRQSRLSSLTRALTPRPSSCMSALPGPPFSCSFLALTFSQARRVARPRLSRLEPTLTTAWTTSGSPSPHYATLPPVGRPAPGRGSPRLKLVLTLTNDLEEERELLQSLQSQHTAPPPPNSNLDYLRSMGHCIWIT